MHPRSTHQPTWWRTPQRVWLRRAVLQVHLWLGLLLTLYAIVIGLSGSALVFKREIESARHPSLFHIQPGVQRLSLEALVHTVEQSRPGWRVASLRDFDADQPLTLLLRPNGSALSNNYRLVVVQPYTGAVLADAMRFDGWLGWLSNLHFYLLAGRTGLLISGWMSLGLVLLCLSGMVVWWPGISRCASALVLRPRRRWRRLNWDLHAVTGFWVSLPLLLLGITGCYFSIPQPVTAVFDALTFSHPAPETPALPAAHAGTQAPLTADQAFLRATQLLPPDAPIGYFMLPMRAGGPYYATGYQVGTAPYSSLVSLSIDGRTGKPLSRSSTRDQPLSRRLIQYFFAFHFGSFGGNGTMGTVVKAVWVLVGLAPALLAVTGVIMFASRKLRFLFPRKPAAAQQEITQKTVAHH